MEGKPKVLRYYLDEQGNNWYDGWLSTLGDAQARSRIRVRIDRALGAGLKELRLHFGPGYRVYFGEDGAVIVVVLIGGDKSSQVSDLSRARTAWADYLLRRSL